MESPPLLGSTPIERAYKATQLGISLKFYRDDEPASKHGYIMVWESTKTSFASIAYRLQDIRNYWNPKYRWDCVDSYFVGKINYGSCMYWLRAEPRQIQNVRHYYAMAMASVLGMQTPEITSMRCCKLQRVSNKHKTYLKLCEFLNMPTLRDLAIRDARVLLRQWQSYRPDQFVTDENGYIVSAVDRKPGSLLVELVELSKQSINNWYPEYNEWKKARKDPLKRHLKIEDKFKPAWLQFWEKVNQKCDQEGNENFKFKNLLFTMMCRDHFDVLEPYSRVRKQIITPIKVFDKRQSDSHMSDPTEDAEQPQDHPVSKRPRLSLAEEVEGQPEGVARVPEGVARVPEEVEQELAEEQTVRNAAPTDPASVAPETVANHDESQAQQSQPSRNPRKRGRCQAESDWISTVSELSCSIGCPPVQGRKNRPCRICGFVIRQPTTKKARASVIHVKFESCEKEAHIECWQKARKAVFAPLRCQEIKTWLAKDRTSARAVTIKKTTVRDGDLVDVAQ